MDECKKQSSTLRKPFFCLPFSTNLLPLALISSFTQLQLVVSSLSLTEEGLVYDILECYGVLLNWDNLLVIHLLSRWALRLMEQQASLTPRGIRYPEVKGAELLNVSFFTCGVSVTKRDNGLLLGWHGRWHPLVHPQVHVASECNRLCGENWEWMTFLGPNFTALTTGWLQQSCNVTDNRCAQV